MKGFVRMPNVSRLLTKKQIISLLLIICMAMVGTFWFLGCNKTSFEKEPYKITQEEEKTLPRPTDGTTPADHSPIDNYYIATGVLRESGGFVGKTTGTSVSLGINQDIYASRTVLGDDVFKESYSFGVKKVGMQFYVSGKNYVLRDTSALSAVDSPIWDKSTPYKVSENTFFSKFGGKPLGICNYIVKEETATGQYIGLEDGLHAFRYDFDIKTATPKMLLEMQTMSGMDSTFTRAAIIVYMDDDWVVKKTTTDCEYVVSYGMLTPSCTESITEVFTALGEDTPLPFEDVFGPYLDAEVTDPVEKEPTALDYIMSGFGAYMAGTPLVATIETDGIVNLRGAASVNIDINELSNIKARVKIDELSYQGIMLRDLFVAYSDDTVYIKYGDVKAKGKISDATALVKKLTALLAPTDGETASGGDLFGDFDAGALMDGMTLDRENGIAVVGITIPLGDVTVTATLNFTDGDTIGFIDAYASISDKDGSAMLTAVVKPVESAAIPEIEGSYYDVIPLIDELIDNEGNICVNAVVNADGILGAPIALNAKVNLASLRVDASGTIGNNKNTLRVRFDVSANTLYLAFGDLKASFNLEDIPAIKDKFAGLSSTSANATETVSTVDIIKNILDNLTVTEANGKLTIALKYNDLNASVTLDENNGAFGFGNISASYGKLGITLTSGTPENVKVIEDGELREFRNILPVLDVVDENLSINLRANVSVNAGGFNLENVPVDLSVDLRTLNVMAKATIFEKDIFVKYADDTVFVSALGINAKASKSEITSVVEKFKNIFSSDGASATDAVSGLLEALDLDNILASLNATATESGDGVVLSGNVSLNDVLVSLGITLADDGSAYSFGGVTASVKSGDTEIVSASVVSVDASALDFSPLSDSSKFYGITSLIDELIDDEGNIKLQLSVDTDVTDSIGDIISGAITDITDGKTEVVKANKKPIIVTATLNLKSMRLTANVLGINLLVDLKTYTLYAECGGAKVLLECGENFGTVKSILEKLAPTIQVFAPTFDPNAEISVDIMAMAEKLIKALNYTTDENGVTLSIPIETSGNTVNVSVRLNAKESDYGFGGVVVAMSGTKITVTDVANTAMAPDVFASDGSIKSVAELKAGGYIDLYEVVDKFADTLNAIFTAKNLEVTLGEGCSVTLNGTTISLSGNIKVEGVNKNYNDGVIKVRADLKITITKANGSSKTYGLTVIYITPKEGDHYTETIAADNTTTRTVNKPNAYFKLDRLNGNNASTGKPIIGTFSTANVNETMDILKTIYNNMPELQGALSFLIPESADGQFHMPSIEDIGALVDNLTFDKDGGVLGASLTVASLIHDEAMQKKMSDPIVATLTANDGGVLGKLGVTIGLTMKDESGNASTTVALNGAAENVEDFPADTFTYNANENTARTSDFTSINDLLRALAKTSENRHFEMSASISINVLMQDAKIDLSASIDVEGKNTYVTATLKRHYFTGASIVYSDFGGTTTLSYYGEKGNEMFYVHNNYCTKRKSLFTSAKYADEYFKYTKDEFTNNLQDIMLKDIMHFSSAVTGQIEKSDGDLDISIENIFTKYSYGKDNNGDNIFTIDVNLNSLTGGAINNISLIITSDSNDTFKTIKTNTFTIIAIIKADVAANLTNFSKNSQNIKAGMPTPNDSTYKWSSYHK